MKTQFVRLIFGIGLLVGTNERVSAQELPSSNPCATSEAMQHYYQSHPEAEQARIANEKFTQEFIAHAEKFEQRTTAGRRKYVIPCIFHVYGTSQGGKTVSLAIIQDA